MKKLCIVGAVVILSLLLSASFAFAGFSLSLEQEAWSTEMEMTSDPFAVLVWDEREENMVPLSSDGEAWVSRWMVYDMDERANFNRTFLKGTYAFSDRLSVYGKVGMARLYPELKWMRSSFRVEGYYPIEIDAQALNFYDWELIWAMEYFHEGTQLPGFGYETPTMELGLNESESGSVWEVGLDFILASNPNYSTIFNVEYLSQENTNLGRGSFEFREEWYYDSIPESIQSEPYEEWWYSGTIEHEKAITTQFAASIRWQANLGRFKPYAGIRYVSLTTDYSGTGTIEFGEEYNEGPRQIYEESQSVDFSYTMQNKDPLGLFGGASFAFSDNLSGNIGVIVQGDWGVSAGIEYRLGSPATRG